MTMPPAHISNPVRITVTVCLKDRPPVVFPGWAPRTWGDGQIIAGFIELLNPPEPLPASACHVVRHGEDVWEMVA